MIWDEVRGERISTGEPFEAQLEVGRDLFFLFEFDHTNIAQAIVDDRLLVKVRMDYVAKEL